MEDSADTALPILGAVDESLRNPVWHALAGPQADFAETSGNRRARRYLPDVSPFSAVARADAEGWAGLAELVGEDGQAVLVLPGVPAPPAGWTELFRLSCYQMIAHGVAEPPELEVGRLGSADVEEMLALVELTEPGPFRRRTLELGTYIGLRREGRLVAMAGERFRPPGWSEVSAVCTHPDARRQGLGAALTQWVVHHVRARGEEAMLHVHASNRNAIRLYEHLGFETRQTLEVVGARWHAARPPGPRDAAIC